ncbi:hypothetical protein [Desulfococcus sp.]|uniref:hypothetical protein n=1 Tax=Desulfococcus sp. TaxID=2025834 RepID=UPI0035941E02
MTSQKLVLLILVLIAVAFAVGVGSPLLTGSGDGEKDLTKEEAIGKAKAYMGSWVGSLSMGLDFLRPALDVNRLTPASPCRKGQKTFLLADDTPCRVQISKKESGLLDWIAFEEMALRADPARVSLQVCHCEKSTGPLPRGAGLRVSPKKLVKFSDRLRIPPRVGTGTVVSRRPELAVSYFPKGEAVASGCAGGEILVCEEVDAASLVILEDGGTVQLACEGCTAANPAAVTLK